MTFKATGIIVRKSTLREADRCFTIYTQEYGKIEALAQGVCKLTSKLSGNLELLNHAAFTIAKGKQIDRIATVDIKNSFEHVKGNLDRLTIALAAMELVDVAVKPASADHALYAVMLDFLSILEDSEECSCSTLLHYFTIKVAVILGYCPRVRQGEAFFEQLKRQSLRDVCVQFKEKNPMIMKIIRQAQVALIDRPLASSAFTEYFEKQATVQKTSRR